MADFYASGMDSAAIEKLGYEPVKPYLKRIDAIADAKGVMQYIAESSTEGSSILFGLQISADEKK